MSCFRGVNPGRVPPADTVATAKRARLYYGLQTEAARHLGVTPNYIHHLLGGPYVRGRRRVFDRVAELVRDCEAALRRLAAVDLNGGRFMLRSNPLSELTEHRDLITVVLIGHSLPPAGVTWFPFGEGTELCRRVRRLVAGVNSGGSESVVDLCRTLSLAPLCPLVPRCAGHLIICWRTDTQKATAVYDSEASMDCLDALIQANDFQLGELAEACKPVALLKGAIPRYFNN